MGMNFGEVDRLAASLAAAPAVMTAGATVVVGDTVEQTASDARAFAPVLTGELHNGIITEHRGLSGRVISTAGHSEYVEDGTSDTAPQPFMRPAAERNEARLAEGLLHVAADIL